MRRQLIESSFEVPSELVSSSVISTSNTGDLSEDEQINYCGDENENENENDTEAEPDDDIEELVARKTRCMSNSSDGTLIVMPNNATITKTVNFKEKPQQPVVALHQFDLEPDADDEEENNNNNHMVIKFKNRENFCPNDELNEEQEEEEAVVEVDSDSDENEDSDSNNNNSHLIQLSVDPLHGQNHAHYFDMNRDMSKQQQQWTQNISGNNNQQNDLSDDEVKEYHFKETYEEDSQAWEF